MNELARVLAVALLAATTGCVTILEEPGSGKPPSTDPPSTDPPSTGPPSTDPPAPCPGDPWARGFAGYGAKQGFIAGDGACGLAFTAGGQIDFGTGATGEVSSLAVVRVDAQGNTAWARHFGHDAGMDPPRVAVDAQGFVTVAGVSGSPIDFGAGEVPNLGNRDVYVARFDPHGQPLWARRFGGSDWATDRATVEGLATMADGAVVLAGEYEHDLDLGLGAPLPVVGQPGGGYVLALDASGNSLWQRGITAAGDGYVMAMADAIAVSPTGEVVVAGAFIGTIDAGTGPLGSAPNTAVSFVAGYGKGGAPLWSRTFGKVGEMVPQALAFDAAGHVVMEGRLVGTIQIGAFTLTGSSAIQGWLAVLGGDHEPTLAQTIAGGDPAGVATDPGGDLLIAGDGVTRLDPAGKPVWVRGAAQSWFGSFGSLAADASGDALVTGAFYGDVDFDVVTLDGGGGNDQRIFVAKLGR